MLLMWFFTTVAPTAPVGGARRTPRISVATARPAGRPPNRAPSQSKRSLESRVRSVALGLLALPPMLNANYHRRFACGIIAAVGTLGTVLPPSIILILLGDQMRVARSEGLRLLGQAAGAPFLLNKLFVGMVVPVLLVIVAYVGIVVWRALRAPESCPPRRSTVSLPRAIANIVPPIAIIATTLFLIVS